MLDLIDPATILAYRYVAWARAYLDNVVQEYAPLARAMAVNDVSDTPNAGRDVFARIEELAGHWAPRFHVLMFDASVCALGMFDMNRR